MLPFHPNSNIWGSDRQSGSIRFTPIGIIGQLTALEPRSRLSQPLQAGYFSIIQCNTSAGHTRGWISILLLSGIRTTNA